jgi:hypothetical protein
MKNYPDALANHILPFNWDNKKVWKLDCAVVYGDVGSFAYLMNLPLWSTVSGCGMLFDISPNEVLSDPSRSPYQALRVDAADITFPLDFLSWNSKIWILDGVHRLAKLIKIGENRVSYRIHESSVRHKIEIG